MAYVTSGAGRADLARADRSPAAERASRARRGRNYRPPVGASPRAELRAAAARLGYATGATRALRADAPRSDVRYGGEIRALRRTRLDGSTYYVRVRVGADRSELPAVASVRRNGRTIRVGAGEPFDSPGALRI